MSIKNMKIKKVTHHRQLHILGNDILKFIHYLLLYSNMYVKLKFQCYSNTYISSI